MEWNELKQRLHSIKPADFEKLAAILLTSFFKIPFVVARSGDQPSGDAISISGEVSMQAKLYKGKRIPNAKTVEGDIRQTIRELPYLQVYVLVVSRDAAQLHNTLDSVAEETGLDIVILELSDGLSDLGALCVTFWKHIHSFFNSSDTDQEFSDWIQIIKDDSNTHDKMEDVRRKLENGIQTQRHVQHDAEKYLFERFNREEGFNPINLSQAIDRDFLESQITNWWGTEESPICCLEGKEGYGKTWLAAKAMNSICEDENIVVFWLDSKDWSDCKTIFDLLRTCLRSIYPSYQEGKITKLQNKSAKTWRKTLIVLDGVNEWNAIEAAQRILTEYYNPNSEWADRIHFLLTIRSLDNYPDFESYLPEDCHKISVEPFNDTELQDALTQKDLKPDDLPDSLIEIAKIPRYFQRCLELRNELGSFGVVTKEMVLLADLSDKIKHSDPQIKQKLGWILPEDPKDFFSHLAKQTEWDKIDDAPERLGQLLKECFTDYSKIRLDLEEQGIVRKAGLFEAKLSTDHVLLCWALYLSSLFDSIEFIRIEDSLDRFQQELEPIPQEDVSTEALFAALQLSAISPNTDLSEEQRSQKRTALMLAWFHSHNAQITDERLLFWAGEDPDAYAQVVEFEFRHHNSPNYEESLIEPLAKAWLNKKGDLNQLASRLTKWLLPTYTDDPPEDVVYTHVTGQRLPREKDEIQFQLLDAALSILSQRPDPRFLEPLARCYGILRINAKSDKERITLSRFSEKIGKTRYGVPTLLAQLWKVEYCNSPEHRQFRRELLEECLNDEDIMFMTVAALAEGGRDELWSLVTQEYIKSPYAKERNLGVSILPWFGTCEAINELKRLKLDDQSRWVREHAAWAYEVAQQEYSCREVYRKALQTRDLFRISAVFEQMKPALSPTARWWHREVEKTEFGEEPQDLDSKLVALIDRFWYRWGNSTKTKRNIEVFGRKLREYFRGERFLGGSTPRIAPWWKPTSDSDNW